MVNTNRICLEPWFEDINEIDNDLMNKSIYIVNWNLEGKRVWKFWLIDYYSKKYKLKKVLISQLPRHLSPNLYYVKKNKKVK